MRRAVWLLVVLGVLVSGQATEEPLREGHLEEGIPAVAEPVEDITAPIDNVPVTEDVKTDEAVVLETGNIEGPRVEVVPIGEQLAVSTKPPTAAQLLKEALNLTKKGSKDFKHGVELMRQAGEAGSGEAWYRLGLFYQQGKNVKYNPTEAMACFNKSAADGHPGAQSALAILYATGRGTTEDQGLAVLHWMFASLAGESEAEMALGYRHMYGLSTPKSCDPASNYYRKAAEKVVEEMLSNGGWEKPVTRRLADEVEAHNANVKHHEDEELMHYYEFSAAAGDVGAQLRLGQLHWSGGRGVEQDYGAARRYFEQAANAGDGHAMANLGHIHAQGWGVAVNETNALEWYQKGAKVNNPAALNGLAYMHMHGKGVEKNISHAIHLFQQAADRASPDAQLNLGSMYFNGVGTKRDYGKAMQYFSMAAHNGHTVALYYMAIMHLNGYGTQRSCPMATQWFKMVSERGHLADSLEIARKKYQEGDVEGAQSMYLSAAEIGFEVAQANAAWIYEQQDPPDFASALHLWRRSAEQGNIASRIHVGDALYYGRGTERDLAAAAKEYRVAADAHNAQAHFNLGYMHQYGLGLPQDFYLAKRCYDSAMEVAHDATLPSLLALATLGVQYVINTYSFEVLGIQWDTILIGVLLVAILLLLAVRQAYYR